MKPIIIIPTYNEKENIINLVKLLLKQRLNISIIIVDDNSPDLTGQEADKLSEIHPEVKVIHRPNKLGLGTAYLDGFKYALSLDGNPIFEMDSDFSHNPDELYKFLDAVQKDKGDLIIGSRYINGSQIINWDCNRYLASKIINVFTRIALKTKIHDCTSGYRCYKAEILKNIPIDKIKSKGYCFQIEILNMCLNGGYKVYEIPISFTGRTKGLSKVSLNEVIETMNLLSRIYLRNI
jgi:dolichol-phosphate mannosyltransferase